MAKIKGTAGDDILTGTDGRDTLDGMAGRDTMSGGLGHDYYVVDDPLDEIIELAGEGTDWVRSYLSYTLHAHVENAQIVAKTGNLNLLGNDQDNTLIGNRGNNTLDGGAGADYMKGGKGNDTYFVNQFATEGVNKEIGVVDVIHDTGGIDTVAAGFFSTPFDTLTYIMQKGLENARFIGDDSTNMTVTGNNSKNSIITADGNDTIDGGKGADIMDAGGGQNTFFIDHKKDVIIDNDADYDADGLPVDGAADTAIVNASTYAFAPANQIEFIELGAKAKNVTGSDSNNTITGNAKANRIYGGGGDDIITGGGGADRLYGDAGADTFAFKADAFDGLKKPKAVKIMDFSLADGDVLDISDIISFEDGTIISSYIHIVDKGRDSAVYVNINEAENVRDYVHVATLVGINGLTGESALYDDGHLIMAVS